MSNTQGDLAQRAEELAEELSDLSKKHPNLSGKAGRDTQEAADKMEEGKEELDKPDLEKALAKGKEAEQSLKNALDEMDKAENRNLQEALDRLARDTANAARDQANIIANYMRSHGPFEPHRLPLEELEYTTMPAIMERLKGRWVAV